MVIVAYHKQRFLSSVRKEALKRLEKAAKLVRDKAKVMVAVDTGALKKSIHYEIDEDNLHAIIIADSLRKKPAESGTLSYAWYVETGEGTGPAQPYMRPALHSSLEDIERIFN